MCLGKNKLERLKIMDRKIPEDIEYKKSISNFSAFMLVIKKDFPKILNKTIESFQGFLFIAGIVVAIAGVVFLPFVSLALFIVLSVFSLGRFIVLHIKKTVQKGHSYHENTSVDVLDKIKMFKIEMFPNEMNVVLGFLSIVSFVNCLAWIAIFAQ